MDAPSRRPRQPHPNLKEGRFGMDLDVTIFIQAGIFLLVLFGLNPILLKPIQRIIEARHAGTGGKTADTARLTAEASAKRKEYEDRMPPFARMPEQREKLCATKAARTSASLLSRLAIEQKRPLRRVALISKLKQPLFATL